MDYTITLTDTEKKSMDYITTDIDEWITNAAQNRARIAKDEIEVEKEHGYGDTPDNMLVTDVNSDGNYGMQYAKLVPILINAVKELSEKNDALEARLAALEGS